MSRRRGHSFARRWVVSFLLLFGLSVLWGLASPFPSGPDEAAHIIKAAAIERGTLIGNSDPGQSSGTVFVHEPTTFYNVRAHATCTYADIDTPTGCGPAIVSSSKVRRMSTYEGRYPPLYYLLTGFPTLFSSNADVVYAMRAVSALIVAALLGLAFAAMATWGRSRLALIGLGVAVTPTVLYLGGVVNPSAMEVAGGIALWSTLCVLVFYEYEHPPVPLVVAAVIGSVALSGSRALSTGFFALIVVSVAAFRPSHALALLRSTAVRIALGIALIWALFSGIYVILARSYLVEAFQVQSHSTVSNVAIILGRSPRYLHQAIGAFGSPNFGVPEPVLIIWYVAGFGLLLAGIVFGRRRDARLLFVVAVVLGFVIPFAIIYSHVKADGPIWQGRYSLPIIAGLPILGGLLVTERFPQFGPDIVRRLGVVIVLALVAGDVGSFYWMLRRYTVGLGPAATDAFRHVPGYWAPLIPAPLVFVLFVVLTLLFAAWLLLQVSRRVPAPVPGRRRGLAPPGSVGARPAHRRRAVVSGSAGVAAGAGRRGVPAGDYPVTPPDGTPIVGPEQPGAGRRARDQGGEAGRRPAPDTR